MAFERGKQLKRSRRFLCLVLLGALLTARPAAGGIVSLAVPPFENLTGEPRLDWIGEGFGRTLVEKLNRVAEISAATVKARGVVAGDRKIDARQLQGDGALAAADLVVLGSIVKGADVDRLDEPLEVVVRLVDPRTTRQMESREIVGTMRQIFSLEADLAEHVTRLLGFSLTAAEAAELRTPPTRSLVAYKETILGEIYLEDGRYEQALAMFDEALRHHPGIFYPRGHRLLAQAYLLSGRRQEMLERFRKDAAALSGVYYDLAVAQEHAGDPATAAENFGLFLKYTDRKTLLWRRLEPGATIVGVEKEMILVRDREGRITARSRDRGEPVPLPAGVAASGAGGERKPESGIPAAVAALIPKSESAMLRTGVLIVEDSFFYGLANGYVIGRTSADGRRIFVYRTVGKPTGSIVTGNGVLYVADDFGRLYALGILQDSVPSDLAAYLRLAALAERQGKTADAGEIYRFIVDEIKYNVPEAWHGLWTLAQAGGDEAGAAGYWRAYADSQY